jgi:outer membrane protein assembly factor BamA
MDLVYDISEGKPFNIGRIFVKGNAKTEDKVVLRELRVSPGQNYDSSEIADAIDRLRGTPYFTTVAITPIGDDPGVRDVLVEVNEQRTASINAGVGISSNGGIGGDVSYEQKNFDITNLPASLSDVTSERAFTGAGQDFRASFSPGTVATNADVSFFEPYLLDQPYSFGNDLYLRTPSASSYVDRRIGDQISLGKRFDYVYSAVRHASRRRRPTSASFKDEYVTDANGHTVIVDENGKPLEPRPGNRRRQGAPYPHGGHDPRSRATPPTTARSPTRATTRKHRADQGWAPWAERSITTVSVSSA